MNTIRPRVLYIADPLCGWCYAFGHRLSESMEKFAHLVDLEVILGGMITGEQEGPVGQEATHMLAALPALERTTGVRFGERYKTALLHGERWRSSVHPSRAVVAMRTLMPERAGAFLHAVQRLHFQEGADLNDLSLYAPLAAALGVDEELYAHCLADERMITETEQDFAMVAQWGITGFPALAAEVGTRFYGLAHGYRTTSELDAILQALLKVDPTSA